MIDKISTVLRGDGDQVRTRILIATVVLGILLTVVVGPGILSLATGGEFGTVFAGEPDVTNASGQFSLNGDGLYYENGTLEEVPTKRLTAIRPNGEEITLAEGTTLKEGKRAVPMKQFVVGDISPGETVQLRWVPDASSANDSYLVDNVTFPNVHAMRGKFTPTNAGLVYEGGELHEQRAGQLIIQTGSQTPFVVEQAPIKRGEVVVSSSELKGAGVTAGVPYDLLWRDQYGVTSPIETYYAPERGTQLAKEWNISKTGNSSFIVPADLKYRDKGLAYVGEKLDGTGVEAIYLTANGNTTRTEDGGTIFTDTLLADKEDYHSAGVRAGGRYRLTIVPQEEMDNISISLVAPGIESEVADDYDLRERPKLNSTVDFGESELIYELGTVHKKPGTLLIRTDERDFAIGSAESLSPGEKVVSTTEMASYGIEGRDEMELIHISTEEDVGTESVVAELTVPVTLTADGEFEKTEEGLEYVGGELHEAETTSMVLKTETESVQVVVDTALQPGDVVATSEDFEEIGLSASQSFEIYWTPIGGEERYVTEVVAPSMDSPLREHWGLPDTTNRNDPVVQGEGESEASVNSIHAPPTAELV